MAEPCRPPDLMVQIIEIVFQVSVYASVPACMNAIPAAKKAFQAQPPVG